MMKPFELNLAGSLRYFDSPVIMGILNVTPDSFYGASRVDSPAMARQRVTDMMEAGAGMIDVGACSTRPGSNPCTVHDEIERLRTVLPVVMSTKGDALISVDTFRSDVARMAVEEFGVDVVNDVGGGMLDEKMFSTVASLKVPYVLTHPGSHFIHRRGFSGTTYNDGVGEANEDVVSGVLVWLAERLDVLHSMGVADVIIDPGIGFGKSREDNFRLLDNIRIFEASLDSPVMIGVSRKSMITATLGCDAAEALNGTSVLNVLALEKGAAVLRVHDVPEARDTLMLWQSMQCSRRR